MEQEKEVERWEDEGGAISIKETMALGLCQQEVVGSEVGARNKTVVQEATEAP